MAIKTIYSSFKDKDGRILCLCYADGTFRMFEMPVTYSQLYLLTDWIRHCKDALGLEVDYESLG
jgi:hypothetical protein